MKSIKQNQTNVKTFLSGLMRKSIGGIGRSIIKTTMVCLLFFGAGQSLKAEPFGMAVISNCYQNAVGNLTSTTHYRFLNTPIGRNLLFTSNNPLDILSYDVYHMTGGVWVWEHNVAIGGMYSLLATENQFKIVPNNNPGTIGNTAQPVEIDFVNPTITPTTNQACLTFNATNFRMNLNLDGLCNPPILEISLPASTPNRWGIPANWFAMPLNGGSFSVPVNDEFCLQHLLDQYGNPVSPCLTFDFKITLDPCFVGIQNCPPFVFVKQLSICCFCPTVYHPQD